MGNERAFRRLCEVLGEAELADDKRFASNAERVLNRDALRAELERLLVEQDGVEVCARLRAAGLAVGPVHDTAQVMADPHTLHRGMAAELDWYKGAGTPIKFSRTAGSLRTAPPKFAADAREILAECGYGDDEIEKLAACGVLVEERRR